MRKVFLVFMCLVFIMCLAGCGNDEKIYTYLNNDSIISQNLINLNDTNGYGVGDSALPTINDKIRNISYNNCTLYLVEFEDTYSSIVCTYIKKHLYTPINAREEGYMNDVVFVQYNNIDDIKKRIDGLILSDTFLLYNVLVKKDLINNIEYNETITYYRNVSSEIIWKLSYGITFEENISYGQRIYYNSIKFLDCDNLYLCAGDIWSNFYEIIEENSEKYIVISEKLSDIEEAFKENFNRYYEKYEDCFIEGEALNGVKLNLNKLVNFVIMTREKA